MNTTSSTANSGKPIVRSLVGFALLIVTAIAAYSLYVAVHEPDLQETVILGHEKFDFTD